MKIYEKILNENLFKRNIWVLTSKWIYDIFLSDKAKDLIYVKKEHPVDVYAFCKSNCP